MIDFVKMINPLDMNYQESLMSNEHHLSYQEYPPPEFIISSYNQEDNDYEYICNEPIEIHRNINEPVDSFH
jgi:hypothetical protein